MPVDTPGAPTGDPAEESWLRTFFDHLSPDEKMLLARAGSSPLAWCVTADAIFGSG
jgi:hypothetical protein